MKAGSGFRVIRLGFKLPYAMCEQVKGLQFSIARNSRLIHTIPLLKEYRKPQGKSLMLSGV